MLCRQRGVRPGTRWVYQINCPVSVCYTNSLLLPQVSLILCSAFLLAWSPYAVISMWSACGHQVPPLHSILASLFAKSASSFNPFIYLGLNSKFRQDFRAQFHCLRHNPDLSHRPDEVQIDLDVMEVNGGVDDLDSGVELGSERGVEERGGEPEESSYAPDDSSRSQSSPVPEETQ